MYAVMAGCAAAGLAVTLIAAFSNTDFLWVQIAVLILSYLAVSLAAVIDYKYMIIPNQIPLVMIAARMVIYFIEIPMYGLNLGELLSSATGCLLSAGILLIASKLSRGGVGGGDVKLFAALGFAGGFEMAFSVLLAALLACAVIGGIIVFGAKKKKAREALPFAPFIWAGYVVYMLSFI